MPRLVLRTVTRREQRDASAELEAYDAIGLQYYYLGNLTKAKYYHSRMMSRDVEGESAERAAAMKMLADRRRGELKKCCRFETFFESFAESTSVFAGEVVFPHESHREIVRYGVWA